MQPIVVSSVRHRWFGVAAFVVLMATAALLSSGVASACGGGGCGGPAPIYQTCALTGGGFTTVQCYGQSCGSGRTCGKCDALDAQGNVVGCGCVCVQCSNCGFDA